MTIKAKIISLVVAFALVAGSITALGLKTMQDYQAVIDRYERASENALRGEKLNRLLSNSAVEMRGVYLAKSREAVLVQADRVEARSKALEDFLASWQAYLRPGEVPEFAQARTDSLDIARGGYRLAKVAREQSQAAADAVGNKDHYRIAREAKQARMEVMVQRITGDMQTSRKALETYQQSRMRDFVLIAAAGTLGLFGLSLWVAISSIANPLNRIRQSIIRISEGAYDTAMPEADGNGEIGEIWGALSVLKERAREAERLTNEKLDAEHRLRELVLD